MKITVSVIKADIGSIGGHTVAGTEVAEKASEMRRQGFFGPAMLPMGELEYTGIVEKLTALDERFVLRPE